MTNAVVKAGTNGVTAHVLRNAPAVTNILVPVPAMPVAQALLVMGNIQNVLVKAVMRGKTVVVKNSPHRLMMTVFYLNLFAVIQIFLMIVIKMAGMW